MRPSYESLNPYFFIRQPHSVLCKDTYRFEGFNNTYALPILGRDNYHLPGGKPRQHLGDPFTGLV